jgi:tetratricopeptide (TPR) repeat protein
MEGVLELPARAGELCTRSVSVNQVPPTPHTFIGRTVELGEMIHGMVAGTNVLGLKGQGGIGKTALARLFAENIRDSFPDGQLFLDLQGYSNTEKSLGPEAFLAHVIQSLEPAVRLPDDSVSLQRLYRRLLTGRRLLLIADNVVAQPALDLLLPPAGSLLLLTSRENLSLAGLDPMRLGVLPEADAFQVLRRICPRLVNESDTAIRQIVERSGFLPLALDTNAHTLLTNRLLNVHSLCERLEGTDALVRPVEAAFQVSYDHLSSDKLRHAFRQLAAFPAQFDYEAAASLWACDDKTLIDYLGALESASLVLHDDSTLRLRLHDLGRLFAENKLCSHKGERAYVLGRHAEYYVQLLCKIDELYKTGDQVKAFQWFDAEWANIESGWRWAFASTGFLHSPLPQDFLGIPEPPTVPKIDDVYSPAEFPYELLVSYPIEGFYLLSLRQHPRDRIVWLEAAVAAARKLGDRQNEANALGNLGGASAELGNVRRSLACYKQQLTIAREIIDRRGEGHALGNIGVAFVALGKAHEAIGLHEQQLFIAREVIDPLGEGRALGNLGVAWKSIGDLEKAIWYHEEALAVRRAIPDLPGVAVSLGNLGVAWTSLRNPRKAIEYHEQRLDIARQLGDRRGEGNALGNLGSAWAVLGDPRKSAAYHEQRVAKAREVGDRRGEGSGLHNLALQIEKLGDLARATAMLEECLAIREEIEDPCVDEVRVTLSRWRVRRQGTNPSVS